MTAFHSVTVAARITDIQHGAGTAELLAVYNRHEDSEATAELVITPNKSQAPIRLELTASQWRELSRIARNMAEKLRGQSVTREDAEL